MNVLMFACSLLQHDPRIRREAEALARSGERVTLFVLSENGKPRSYERNGVTIVELDTRKYRGKDKAAYMTLYLRFLLQAFVACSRRFLKGEVDVVHIHNMPNFLVFTAILPRLFGKKLILDIHDSIPETFEGKFARLPRIVHRLFCLEEKISSALAHRVICVNEVQKEVLVGRGIAPEKITTVINVPDQDLFKVRDGHREVNGSKPSFNLVYHGTVDRMMGLDMVIAAVSQLRDRIPEIQMHIIGAGPHLDALVAEARRLGVEDRVQFSMKSHPLDMMPAILDKMDIGILAHEVNAATELMLPVKLLEYMAMGLPAVAPRLKTIRHYFDDDMVTYFEPGNIDSLTEALVKIYNDRSGRKKQAERALAFLDRYGWEKHQQVLVNMYHHLN